VGREKLILIEKKETKKRRGKGRNNSERGECQSLFRPFMALHYKKNEQSGKEETKRGEGKKERGREKVKNARVGKKKTWIN